MTWHTHIHNHIHNHTITPTQLHNHTLPHNHTITQSHTHAITQSHTPTQPRQDPEERPTATQALKHSFVKKAKAKAAKKMLSRAVQHVLTVRRADVKQGAKGW